MPKTVKLSGDKNPADNLLDIVGTTSTSVKAGKGNDLISDHGGAEDQVRGGSGDDTVAFYYTGNETGINDYDGDKDNDTLELHFTRAQWMELNALIQTDLDGFLAHLASSNKKAFEFQSVGIEASEFENVRLFVEGLELAPEDDSVTALADTALLNENTAVSDTVLTNDVVPDLVRQVDLIGPGVSRGSLVLNSDGSFHFETGDDFEELALNETTTVGFNYRVTDATGDSDESTMTITINGQNDAPLMAGTESAIIEDGQVVSVDLSALGSDIDSDDDGTSLIYTINSAPAEGLATIVGTDLQIQGGSDFQYLAAGETTDINIGVTATDRHSAAASNTIAVTVTGSNDLPILTADEADAVEDGSVTIDVLANDTDVDATDVLRITAASGAAHGTVVLTDGDDADELANDLLLYTPNADFSGVDNFDYTVSDGNGGIVTQTARVNVAARADAPTVSQQIIAGSRATQFTLRVEARQTDLDNSEVIDRIELTGTAANGSTIDLSSYVSNTSWSPASASGSVTADFQFTVPAGTSSDFEITATAVSKEPSNGDEASSETSIAIATTGSAVSNAYTFNADNQSIWAGGNAFNYNGTFNTGGSLAEYADFGVSVIGPIDIRVLGTGATTHFSTVARTNVAVDVGLQSRFGVSGGEVDAVLNYNTDVTSTFNKTTDVLSIQTRADNLLQNNGFTASTPNINFEQALTDFSMNLDFALWFWGYLHLHYTAGTQHVVHMPNINHGLFAGIPSGLGLDLRAAGLIDSDGLSLARYDGNALHLLEGLYTQYEIAGTKSDGLGNELFSWYLNSHQFTNVSDGIDNYYNQVTGSESRTFASLRFDLDGIASHFRGIPNPVHQKLDAVDIGPLHAGVEVELLDIDLVLSTAYRQVNRLQPGNLQGTIVFEDDSRLNFTFGQEIHIGDASARDANGDGNIDYYFEMRPDIRFQTNAYIDMSLRDEVDILMGSINASLDGFGGIGDSVGPAEQWNGTIINEYVPIQLIGHQFWLNAGVVTSEPLIV